LRADDHESVALTVDGPDVLRVFEERDRNICGCSRLVFELWNWRNADTDADTISNSDALPNGDAYAFSNSDALPNGDTDAFSNSNTIPKSGIADEVRF
jgi:hypothetical protein